MRTSLLIAAFSGAVLLAGCRVEQAKTTANVEPPPVAIPVATLAAEPFQNTVPVTGTLISNTTVDIKAETIGRVTRFDKEEGEVVKAGETIVWLNDENYQLAIRQAQTAVKVADATLERARLLEAHSRSEMERARNLVKSGGITDKDLKAAELAQQDAKAQIVVAEAQGDQARASLELAEKRLRDTEIHAPVTGVIQKKYVNKGAYVEAPTQLFSVVDNSRLELASPLASSDLAPIQTGQRVTFSVNSFPGEKFEGRVVEIAPAMDADSRSAKARIQVVNAGGKLKAGMFAQGEILTGTAGKALMIPSSAVYRDDRSSKSSYVFVVVNGKAMRRNVRIGHEGESRMEIVDGLKPGDVLITEQSIEVAEGVRVEARS